MRSVCVAYALREQRLQVMAEVMLLNVARWLKTRPQRNRVVYNVVSSKESRDSSKDSSKEIWKDSSKECLERWLNTRTQLNRVVYNLV
jgi:hypothetical protein